MTDLIDVSVTPQQLVAGRDCDLVIQLSNTGSGVCSNIVFKVGLPRQILLLRGNSRVEVARLAAGESVTRSVRVRPRDVGTWIVNSANFSYRDRYGTSHRVSNFLLSLTVVPAAVLAAPPEPEFVVGITSNDLPYDEWGILHGTVTNTGSSVLRGLTVTLSGPVAVDPHNGRKELGSLRPNQQVEFSFFVRARESGGQVPLHVNTDFVDEAERTRRHDQPVAMRVVRSSAGGEHNRTGGPRAKAATILYLAANPTDTERLRLDQEIREIDETIRLGQYRDNVELKVRPAARFKDISQALLDLTPRIVHFSGHGASDGRLYTANEVGRSKMVTAENLAPVFELMARHVECVIVNACHSELLARAVARHIDYVVGMRDVIGDRGAIAFSVGFYQAVAADRPIQDAFTLGCAHLENVLHRPASGRIPLLLRREQ